MVAQLAEQFNEVFPTPSEGIGTNQRFPSVNEQWSQLGVVLLDFLEERRV
jgi:hypothetical protein